MNMDGLTGLHVILGQFFDSGAYPPGIGECPARLGRVVLGPQGFLDLMETRLGLVGPQVPEALRIGQYYRAVVAVDDSHRFYSRSFASDGWTTARELLRWRDSLVLGGWSGNPLVGSHRLESISALEKAVRGQLSQGFSDRFSALQKRLGERQIDLIIELVEPLADWPLWWQTLFSRLTKSGVTLEVRGRPATQLSGDLGRAQNHLLGRTFAPYEEDDTLILVDGANESELAEVLTAWLAADHLEKTVVIAERQSELLDRVLKRSGLPGFGVTAAVPYRTTLEILPAACDTFWQPFDARSLLNWLSLPQSPLPGRLRYALAHTVAEVPGVGGKAWHEAISRARGRELARLDENEADKTVRDRQMAQWDDDVQFWLQHTYYDPIEGMPTPVARAIAGRLRQWAVKRNGAIADPLLALLGRYAGELMDTMEVSGLESISRTQLDRMWDSVVGPGGTRFDACEEASPWGLVKHPGAIYQNVDTVVWWGFYQTDRQSNPRTPWNAEEEKILQEAGIIVESPTEMVLREAKAWAQPLFWATKHVLLLSAHEPAGKTASVHPLWDELKIGSTMPKRVAAAALLHNEENFLAGRRLLRYASQPLRIPDRVALWPLGQSGLRRRTVESATSIETLLGCSLSWVFQYGAGLRPAAALQVPPEPLMVGSLVHAIVHDLIGVKPEWDPKEAAEASYRVYERLVPQMASPLLQPERRLDYEKYRLNITRAMLALFELLRKEGLRVPSSEASEFAVERAWQGEQRIRGTLDLIAEDPKGDKVILDLKWSAAKRYQDLVDNGTAVQLATYQWLLQEHHTVSRTGYFLLKNGQVIWMADSEDGANVWRRTQDAYQTQLFQLEDHAVATGLLREEAVVDGGGFSIEPPCTYCQYGTLCGMRRIQ